MHNRFGRNQRNRKIYGGQNRSPRFRKSIKAMDPSLLVRKAEEQVQETFVPVHEFADFQLGEQLKRNIEDKGYKKPTAIQDQGIPAILAGKDAVGIANTGTGKTAAFLIPLIEKIYQDKAGQVLIVAPTRELAVQINDELRSFVRSINVFSSVCIGGVPMGRQISEIRRNPHFVIGTPGRIKDLEKQGVLKLHTCNYVVLDEVDRMLDMGFVRDIEYLISKLPIRRQSLFFSATMPEKIESLARTFLKEPMRISVVSGKTAMNVDQDIVKTNGRAKIDVLHELLSREDFGKVLVFGRTKWGIEKMVGALEKRGIDSVSIHGNKNQNQRQRALDLFKTNKVRVLLATDIASRGLDISGVTHVVNFDMPETYEDYVHRIGRTGRAGNKGVALTLVD